MSSAAGRSDWRRRLALGAVVLSAAGLALYWVFLVPIYQAPDEPMNLDYALAICEHRGLFWVHYSSYEALPTSVHPHTPYLADRCRSGAVAFRPQAKMPADYGTWEWFTTVDREAPPRPARPITTPNKPFAVYPYGYYALLATWIGCLHFIHDGPVFVFFGARILSVLLLIGTLLTIDATLRRLHFKPWPALLLTAIIGFFPLTTFVASAVQSDNLSFALVSVNLYLALVVRDEPANRKYITLLGLALGALLVTKVHFYACVALPILLMLSARISRSSLPWSQRGLIAGLLLAPSLLTGGLYLWTTWGTTNFYYPPTPQTDAVTHTLNLFRAALVDYYAGTTHESFWGRFGWMDTPLVIRGRRTTEVIQFVIQMFAWLYLALTLLRLEQVASRLLQLVRRGRGRSAWQIAVSDPLTNSYFLFTLFMLYLYIRVDNRFGAQGRNWLPLLLPIFLVGIRYAPKALSLRGSRKLLSGIVMAGLLFYAVVGSYYSLHTLKKRYYVPHHSVTARQEAVHGEGS